MKEGRSKRTDDQTPMIRQYLNIKKQYKDAIVLFRVGDFYETFFEDAKTASKVLNIALTSRGFSSTGEKIPLAGIPYFSLEQYLYKLVNSGLKVAICEQMEDPRTAKGIVKRDVIRVVTSGTIIDEKVIDGKTNNHILSLYERPGIFYFAYCDISTGEFYFSEAKKDDHNRKILSEIVRISPVEIIVSESDYSEHLEGKYALLSEIRSILGNISIHYVDNWKCDLKYSKDSLLEHLKINDLHATGFEYDGEIVSSAMLLAYIEDTQKAKPEHIKKMSPRRDLDFLFLDLYTQLNLDLIPSDKNRNANLFKVLDDTKTAMGGRLLKQNILQPLVDIGRIKKRLDFIEILRDISTVEIENELSKLKDIERTVSKISLKIIRPSEFLMIGEGLGIAGTLNTYLSSVKCELSEELYEQFKSIKEKCKTVKNIIDKAISESPPALIGEGIFKDGYNEELDRLRNIKRNGKKIIGDYLNKIKNDIGAANIKLGYNKVMGYYFEITKNKMKDIELPENAIRKQTLVGSERFITEELKNIEVEITSVEEKILDLERSMWEEFIGSFGQYYETLSVYGRIIANIDYFISMKNVSLKYGYVKPEINSGTSISIIDGRHPVIEQQDLGEPYIPNDTLIDNSESQIQIITGPNMSGKSTYLRQVATIVLMAQMGSFVPANEAKIGVVDRIFSRIGASDNLALGQSTFMVEMNEVSNILNSSTDKSLIILDEMGRGTSTYDGLSIAWAVIEYIHDTPSQQAKTLFATHYHEITRTADYLERVEIYKVDVKEYAGKIMFLRKVIKGSADRSYGIYVAELAGIPKEVILRATEILSQLENPEEKGIFRKRINYVQETLFSKPILETSHSEIIEKLKSIDIEKISPVESLNILNELIKEIYKNN